MKNLVKAFFMNRDKHTESMKPIVLSTLARTVFFPDGKSLLEKWNEEIVHSIILTHTEEDVSLEDNSYKWSCTTFGDKKFQLTGRFRPNIANLPTQVGNSEGSGYFTIQKKADDGTIKEENIPYGSGGIIEQYRFALPLPTDFAEGRTANIVNAAINITEGSESTFLTKNTFHMMFTEYKNGNLFIYVNHYRGLDAVDLSALPYISEDFSISIDGLFV